MEQYFSALRKCALFQGIEDGNLSDMLGCLGARVSEYGKDETILAEEAPANHLGIVLSGMVQIVMVDYFGNRNIVAALTPSEIFGEAFACAEVETMPVNVIAATDATVLLVDVRRITQSCSNACSFHSRIIFNLMKVVARKNLLFHEKIAITSKRTTREKLMSYLLLQAKKHGSNRFTIPYDRQGLADYLAVERSGLSAEIGKLRREGIIACERSTFTLL